MTNEKDNIIKPNNFITNLSQYSKKKKGFTNELRRLIITVSLFLIMQIIFISIDGTFLDPNLNKVGNFVSNIAENRVFEWIIIYDNPIFKFVTVVAILHIIYVLIKTLILGVREKNKKPS